MTTPTESSAQAPEPAQGGTSEKVPWPVVLTWGSPVFALASTLFFVQFFFLKFATDVLLIAPLTAGAIFAFGRVWDAFSDPIVGTWSDRTKSRLGRRRPWMLAGVPLLVVSVTMVWAPPGMSKAALVAWEVLALFLFYSAFTVYGVPHQSMGAELSDDHHDRTRIFGVQSASFTLGMVLVFPAIQIVTVSDDPRGTTATIGFILAGLAAVMLMIPPLGLRERADYQGRGSEQPLAAMRDVIKNPHARRLLVTQLVQMLGIGVVGVLSPYQIEYILKRPDLIGSLPGIFVLCNVASIPLWIRLSRRYGKKEVWSAALCLAGLAFGATFFVGEGDVALLASILPIAGLALGCGGVVGASMLADVIDHDELGTGERKEGAYNAAWGFAIKSANALVIVMVALMLQFSGFEPNVDQTDTAKLALRSFFALPFVMFIAAGLFLRTFGLDAEEYARVRTQLDARRLGAS